MNKNICKLAVPVVIIVICVELIGLPDSKLGKIHSQKSEHLEITEYQDPARSFYASGPNTSVLGGYYVNN